MQKNTNFEKSLCKSARLFSISKKNLDLFLLLQTNTITYQQLLLAGLHGSTEASGRLSLKRLENEGYIIGRQLSFQGQAKYFALTPKGRFLIKEILPEDFTEYLQINWVRRPPSSRQQILHRIYTNDFYFAYIGCAKSQPFPWILEKQLPGEFHSSDLYPRCDGFLQTANRQYYIEQDNGTQSERILSKKISQYCTTGVFNTSSSALLVFCLAFPYKQRSQGKPAFSLYRLMLKLTKLWDLCEKQHGIQLDFQQFWQALHSSDLLQTVTQRELSSFENIRRLHPSMDSLADAITVKRAYLGSSADFQKRTEELDIEYRKRIKSHFSHFYDNLSSVLSLSGLKGSPLFAVPNHRLQIHLPYIMQEELGFRDFLFQCLFYSGLNTNGWKYHCPLRVFTERSGTFFFRLGLCHETFGHIAVENLSIDLSSKMRLEYFSKNSIQDSPMIILLIADPRDLEDFLKQNSKIIKPSIHPCISWLFIDANSVVSSIAPPAIRLINQGGIGPCVLLECDDFDEQIHIIRKE